MAENRVMKNYNIQASEEIACKNVMKDSMQTISMVLLAKRDMVNLRDVIYSVLAQSHPVNEIIVVYSKDIDSENIGFLKRLGSKIRLIRVEKENVKNGLLDGIDAATGEYILCMVEPVILGNRAVAEAISRIARKKVVYVFTERDDQPAYSVKQDEVSAYSTRNVEELVFDKLFQVGNTAILTEKRRISDIVSKLEGDRLECFQYWIVFALAHSFEVCLHSEAAAYGKSAELMEANGKTLEQAKIHRIQNDLIRAGLIEMAIESNLVSDNDVVDCFERWIGYLYREKSVCSYALLYQLLAVKCQETKSWNNLCKRLARELHITRSDADKLLQFASAKKSHRRVAFYENVWTFGGIERVCSLLLQAFEDDYEMLLITSCDNTKIEENGFEIPQSVFHIRTIHNNELSLPEQIAMISLIADIDVFIGNPNIMEAFLPVYEYMKPLPIKTIAYNHYFYYLPYMFDWPWLRTVVPARETALKHADACVWLTDFSAICAKGLNRHTVKIANPNTYSQMPKRNFPKEKNVLVVGRFYDIVKRVDRAFDVFKILLEKDPDAKMWLVGGFDKNTVFPNTNGRTIGDYVEKVLRIPPGSVRYWGEQDDVASFYSKATVLLMPSECEGYCMTLREAGVAGLPAVISNYPGSSDIIENGRNGYSVDFLNNQYEEAAEYIHLLLNDKDLWMKMSTETQEMARSTDIALIKAQWQALFECVMTSDEDKLQDALKNKGLLPDWEKEKEIYKEATGFLDTMLRQKCIKGDVIRKGVTSVSEPGVIGVQDNSCSLWEEQYHIMENTISWRITKPLRLATRLKRSIKNVGLVETIKKICRKIRNRLRK